jgi:hypothetical protein
MRSSYLLTGCVIGAGSYVGILLVMSGRDQVSGLLVLVLCIPAMLAAFVAGTRVWKRLWHSAECPDCRERLELRSEPVGTGSRWGYRCAGCHTFYDSGVAERNPAP